MLCINQNPAVILHNIQLNSVIYREYIKGVFENLSRESDGDLNIILPDYLQLYIRRHNEMDAKHIKSNKFN